MRSLADFGERMFIAILNFTLLVCSLFTFLLAATYASQGEYDKAAYFMAFSLSLQVSAKSDNWEKPKINKNFQ